MTAFDKTREVEWGEAREDPICVAWAKSSSELGSRAVRFEKGGQYADYDFLVYDAADELLCYLEVKCRRIPWGDYKDVLLPARKHDFACQVEDVPCVAVVEFAGGQLVEVDLKQPPSRKQMIQRRGRQRAVPHVLYDEDKCVVL